MPTGCFLLVLREQRWIDPGNVSSYTVDGRKDPITGEANNSSSLRYFMGRCTDFRDGETAPEHLALQLRGEVQLTPKFHAELAGEGIEYNCGHVLAKDIIVASLFPAKKSEATSNSVSGNALVLNTSQSRGFVRMQQGRELTLALNIISQ